MTARAMTRHQKYWLGVLRQEGFVERGSTWTTGQRNRPLSRLVEMGLAEFGWGPDGHMLMTQGYFPIPRKKQ